MKTHSLPCTMHLKLITSFTKKNAWFLQLIMFDMILPSSKVSHRLRCCLNQAKIPVFACMLLWARSKNFSKSWSRPSLPNLNLMTKVMHYCTQVGLIWRLPEKNNFRKTPSQPTTTKICWHITHPKIQNAITFEPTNHLKHEESPTNHLVNTSTHLTPTSTCSNHPEVASYIHRLDFNNFNDGSKKNLPTRKRAPATEKWN